MVWRWRDADPVCGLDTQLTQFPASSLRPQCDCGRVLATFCHRYLTHRLVTGADFELCLVSLGLQDVSSQRIRTFIYAVLKLVADSAWWRRFVIDIRHVVTPAHSRYLQDRPWCSVTVTDSMRQSKASDGPSSDSLSDQFGCRWLAANGRPPSRASDGGLRFPNWIAIGRFS
jgi:hypothetical protein